MESASPASGPSSRPHSGGITATVLRYVEARGVLLSLEAQEAAQTLVRVLVVTLLGAIAALTGWLLLTAGLTALIIEKTGWSTKNALLIFGGIQLLLALFLFLAALLRIRSTRWFADTLRELQKDRTWLATQAKKP